MVRKRVLGTSPKGGGAEKEAADSREARVLCRRQPELPGVQRPGQVSPVRAGPPQPGKHRGTSELLGKPVLAVPSPPDTGVLVCGFLGEEKGFSCGERPAKCEKWQERHEGA